MRTPPGSYFENESDEPENLKVFQEEDPGREP
jgi:hypothetical protein